MRLRKSGDSFIPCQLKIGKIGRVQEMIYSNDPDTPITIKSKPTYAELDQQEFNLYNDDMKSAQYVSLPLNEIDKITIPRSFR